MPVIAGVDHSERAEHVLEQGQQLARVFDTELHAVHVLTPTPDVNHLPREAPPPSTWEGTDDSSAARARAQDLAKTIIENSSSVDIDRTVGLVGDPAEELVRYSHHVDANCIIVCARKRSQMGAVLLGSVTQSLLLISDRPVVAVPQNGHYLGEQLHRDPEPPK